MGRLHLGERRGALLAITSVTAGHSAGPRWLLSVTARPLRSRGTRSVVDLVPERFVAESLVEVFPGPAPARGGDGSVAVCR